MAQALAVKLASAVRLHQQGQLDQAGLLYQQILQAQPQHFDALQLSATIAMQQKKSTAAVALFDQALKIQPRHAAALNNRGNALRDLGRGAEALESYEKALKIQPDYVEALSNRGAALRHLGRLSDALGSYDQALKVKPDYALALTNRGNTLRALGRSGDALDSHDRALKIQPDYADALSSRAAALMDLKRPDEALASCARALQVRPNHPEALNNRGNALWALRQPAQALESFGRALTVRPDYAEAFSNRGNVWRELQRPTEALADFASALRLNPDHAEAHWNEALCRLMLGEFELGWQKYEWRWKKEPGLSMARNFTQALWLGKEPLQGKTILLHAEQGLGDTIQFCRYAKQVAALGARVVLEVQPALKTLLQGLEGASLVIAKGEQLPDFDYHCPLLSLPLAFQADLSNISGQKYLHSDPAKRQQWQTRLGPASKTRVGLVWSGATGHQNDHNRSLSLAQIAPLISEQAQYYCLQKELRPADQATLRNTPTLQFMGEFLKDFSDTAALLEQMDLLITVDTSVAHLAGAMGKEVWIMLPFSPDWRWLLNRSDNPWYESARLFRQPAPGDWASVLAQVQAALQAKS
ncbi:MAG: tetratricopeptide repeat protein [Polaromonas sp.]|nr:tetratricopeptide repeat protein [Polaromonas sp.]